MLDSYPSPYAPLEGTRPAPRALFVDRWGTLLAPPTNGFARRREEIAFLPGAMEALFRASRAGWRIYLLGNEQAVASGEVSDAEWADIESGMLRHLADAGIPVARNYACVDHPEGVSGHRLDSVYFLPNTGAFYHAAHVDGVELQKSWVIGDSTIELVAGWRAGCRLASVDTGLALSDRTFEVDPEIRGGDLRAVVVELLERQRAIHP